MRILVFGAGVIGTIYGHVLAAAGNDVTHYVRPGRKQVLEQGIRIRLFDGRQGAPRERELLYKPKAVEALSPTDAYDLFLVSVRHYQIPAVLPILQENANKADVLFFNNFWAGFDVIDAHLPRSQYLWGFPGAGGGYDSQELNAVLLPRVRLAEIDSNATERLARLRELLTQAGLKVETQDNILHWLWVHFAINGGLVGASFKAGGAAALVNDLPTLRRAILACREALAVCQARGVDVRSFDETRPFYFPSWLAAVAGSFMMKSNRLRRKIAESHTATDELQGIYYDVLETGERLGVPMPNYRSFKPHVDAASEPKRA